MDPRDAALLDLLHRLKAAGYRFVAVTPATHARILAREAPARPGIEDIFGWNRPFARGDVEPGLLGAMDAAGVIEETASGLASTVRVASLDGELYLHSRFPTAERDAVFFGPDTYRFVAFAKRHLPPSVGTLVDLGAGSGAGGIAAARAAAASQLVLVDVNPAALAFAAVNARAAGCAARIEPALPADLKPEVVIANPPFLMDPTGRTYRDGRGLFGGEVALGWTRAALARLAPGGRLLLYTGAAYVAGRAPLLEALHDTCASANATLTVEFLDPDIFGEELERPAYREVARIAAVGLVIDRP